VENLQLQRAEGPAVDGTSGIDLLVAHLDAAYNLARWLLRNETEAEDAVQEAYLRAIRHFQSFQGKDSRAWLLAIVRNGCYDRLKQSTRGIDRTLDEETELACPRAVNPESSMLRQEETDRMRRAVESLPPLLREVLVLRELEEMSYKEISAAIEIPIGTVMSRLSRARQQLQQIVRANAGGRGSDLPVRAGGPGGPPHGRASRAGQAGRPTLQSA
jgi:RNA polymerase sigma-70 factor, ECF subfamily